MLNFDLLEGLAHLVQWASPGHLNADNLVKILQLISARLQDTHKQSPEYIYQLSLTVSRVLDAMADSNVKGLDRETLHAPLSAHLNKLQDNTDPHLVYQAAYAFQALLYVPDDETLWQATRRRTGKVVKGVVGLVSAMKGLDLNKFLEGLEHIGEGLAGASEVFKTAYEDVSTLTKSGEKFIDGVKEGFSFSRKRAWYPALRGADVMLQNGLLIDFKTLICEAPCRRDTEFQWGICRRLGELAANTECDDEARDSAVAFLGEIYRNDAVWGEQANIKKWILDILMKLGAPSGTGTSMQGILLKAVQDRDRRNANMDNLPAQITGVKQVIQSGFEQQLPPQSSPKDIWSALKAYYKPYLVILRVSGAKLDLETCFVNLAIVEAPAQREKEKQNLKEQAAIFHRVWSIDAVERTNMKSSIPLEQLFEKRTLRDGSENVPKRILVQGRAGIGKTTLCKKLVHVYQTGLWGDLFDAVLWLPLRQLKAFKSRTLEGLLREKFFAKDLDQEGAALARALATRAQEGKVLFILDGLDEIVTDAQSDEGIDLQDFLRTLLAQQHVVITSRPSGLDRSLLPSIDLELETVGFSQQNVKEFLVQVLEPEAVRTVQDFIQQTPLIRGLVNIPVQLDVICFSWDSLPTDGPTITMTGLYQLMVRKLWCKDALLLKKAAGGKDLTPQQINKFAPKHIDEVMAIEIQHLGYLAFKGMKNNHQIEFQEDALLSAFEDLRGYCATDLFPSQLVDMMKQMSFLHTADADLDASKSDSQQAWYFLHLTFQEYFAATWIAQHLQVKQPHRSARMMTVEQARAFVQEHKYNPQYEVVWWMVAGLLDGEASKEFFDLLQGSPRDLIGGRHQQILASCLNEARARLDTTVVARLDAELMKWLHFEIQTRDIKRYRSIIGASDRDQDRSIFGAPDRGQDRSILGSQTSFPETLLIENLSSVCSWKSNLVQTLGARSTLSEVAIQSLIGALKDEKGDVRGSAASVLGNQSTLPESAIQPLIGALKD
ncbi:NACHT domain-containing protein, partial [Dissophora ornata]